jgi:probable F420-dependent oxidoreductase
MREENTMIQLGRLGAWYAMDKLGGPKEIRDFVTTVERLGYDTLWYPESRGFESLSVAGFMLANTTKLNVGSSIASIYARDAYTARRGMLSLHQLYGERFILGLGVSHPPMVEGIRGHRYEKPIPAMRGYLDALNQDAGSDQWPVAIAALGPLMLKLAREKTRGALPYNTNPEHTAEAAKILGPDRWLAVEQKVTLETDPAKARALGRKELARYMTLDNYRNNFLRIGFTEADLANGGSDRFIDAMVLWGTAEQVKAGLRAHLAAGANHVAIQPVHADGDSTARDAILRALADL